MFNDPFFQGGGVSSLPSELGIFVSGALIVAVLAVLFAGRGDGRPTVRPVARYLGAIGLLTLFISLFAAFQAVNALTDLVVDHAARHHVFEQAEEYSLVLPVAQTFDFSGDPTNDTNYSAAVISGLVALTTGGIFVVHARWRRRLMDGPNGTTDAAVGVDRAYHYGRCFVAALVTSVAITAAGFGLFEIVAPGIAGAGSDKVVRAEGVSELVSFGLLAVASVMVFLRSWNPVSADLGAAGARRRG